MQQQKYDHKEINCYNYPKQLLKQMWLWKNGLCILLNIKIEKSYKWKPIHNDGFYKKKKTKLIFFSQIRYLISIQIRHKFYMHNV